MAQEQADKYGARQRTDRRERESAPEDVLDRRPVRLESSDEQDEGERDNTHGLRDPGIVEPNAANAVDSCQNADDKKDQQRGDTGAARRLRGNQAQQQQRSQCEGDIMDR